MQRLADQLELDFKGLTLIGKPGERIQFGCSNRIRHTLAPDGSSLTFATKGDLINHWLCDLSFEINRRLDLGWADRRWNEIGREKQFTDEADTLEEEIVGYVALHKPRAGSRPQIPIEVIPGLFSLTRWSLRKM